MGNRANHGHDHDRVHRSNSDLETARRKLRDEHHHEFRMNIFLFVYRFIVL